MFNHYVDEPVDISFMSFSLLYELKKMLLNSQLTNFLPGFFGGFFQFSHWKIGFVDIDLAEYAGTGPCTQRYILQAYDLNTRLDNSLLQITLNIVLKEGDIVFQR